MKSWTLLVLPFALASGFAGFASVRPPIAPAAPSCESQAQSVNSSQLMQNSPFVAQPRTIAEHYMGLIQRSLDTQNLTVEDLKSLRQQKVPTQPRWSARNYKNLSLRNGFERVLHELQPEDWPQIINKLDSLIAKIAGQTEELQNAKNNTRMVFASVPTSFTFPGLSFVKSTSFVTRSGNIFVYASDDMDSWLYSRVQNTSVTIRDFGEIPGLIEFFETTQGEVLFAYFDKSTLHVIDAETGNEKLVFPFSNAGSPTYRPRMFEQDGKLKIVVTTATNASTNAEIYKIDVDSKKRVKLKPLPPFTQFSRHSNGKIYGSNLYHPTDNRAPFGSSRVFLYDVIEDRYDLDILTDKVNPSSFQLTTLEDKAGHPVLHFFVPQDLTRGWFFANSQTGKVEKVDSFNRNSTFLDVLLADKSRWVFQFEKESNSNSIKVELHPLTRSEPPISRELDDFQTPRLGPQAFAINGQDLILLREVRGESENFHFLDRHLQQVGTIFFPEKVESNTHPFVNPVDGIIYMFILSKRTDQWILHQLVGPERLK